MTKTEKFQAKLQGFIVDMPLKNEALIRDFVKDLVNEGTIPVSSEPAITNHTLESVLRALNNVFISVDKANR
jgi:hypothetical protein